MAKFALPTYKEKQALLHGKNTSAENQVAMGQRLLAVHQLIDALDFFAAAKHEAGIAQIRALVVEEGDVFLLRRVLDVQHAPAAESEWQTLGERALALGKWLFAREAFRMSGNRKAMDEVERLINPPKEVEPPAEEGQPLSDVRVVQD